MSNKREKIKHFLIAQYSPSKQKKKNLHDKKFVMPQKNSSVFSPLIYFQRVNKYNY